MIDSKKQQNQKYLRSFKNQESRIRKIRKKIGKRETCVKQLMGLLSKLKETNKKL